MRCGPGLDNNLRQPQLLPDPSPLQRYNVATCSFWFKIYLIQQGTSFTAKLSTRWQAGMSNLAFLAFLLSWTPSTFLHTPFPTTTGSLGTKSNFWTALLAARDHAYFRDAQDGSLCHGCSQPQQLPTIVRSLSWVSHVRLIDAATNQEMTSR